MNNAAKTTENSPFFMMCERMADITDQDTCYRMIDEAFEADEIDYRTARILESMIDRM